MFVVAQLVMSQPTMSMEEEKMLGRFLILNLPRLSKAPVENTFKVLNASEDRLYN